MANKLQGLASWKSSFMAALSGSQIRLGAPIDPPRYGLSSSCPAPGLSCQHQGISLRPDTCCINYPGGQFAATQFWNSDPYAGPPGYLGPPDQWTLHGLWPDHCDGKYDSVCDCDRSGDCSSANHKCAHKSCNRAYSSITNIMQQFSEQDLLNDMSSFWKGINGDEHLWQHEWSKHGTCVSTLEPDCYEDYTETQEVVEYFKKAVEVYKTLPSFQWLAAANITPSTETVYTKAEILAALQAPRGVSAIIQCDHDHPFELREIWYHFVVRGSLQDGEFMASEPDFSGAGGIQESCPDTGIKYLPKSEKGSNPAPAPTHSKPRPTEEPRGRGRLVVKLKQGSEQGCLISNGKWYNTVVGSSCATFRKHDVADGFTLTSSKGPCGVNAADGYFSCGRNAPSTTFKLDNGRLLLKGMEGDANAWSSDSIPQGTEQREVHLRSDGEVQFDMMLRPEQPRVWTAEL